MQETARKPRPVAGDLPAIARISGYSLTTVQQVSTGIRKNERISWAIGRIRELREQAWQRLEKEYYQKYGDHGKNS